MSSRANILARSQRKWHMEIWTRLCGKSHNEHIIARKIKAPNYEYSVSRERNCMWDHGLLCLFRWYLGNGCWGVIHWQKQWSQNASWNTHYDQTPSESGSHRFSTQDQYKTNCKLEVYTNLSLSIEVNLKDQTLDTTSHKSSGEQAECFWLLGRTGMSIRLSKMFLNQEFGIRSGLLCARF